MKKAEIIKVENADFDYIGIAYFIGLPDAKVFIKSLISKLDWVIIEYTDQACFEVGLRYRQEIYVSGR